jgi:hypothetical protein
MTSLIYPAIRFKGNYGLRLLRPFLDCDHQRKRHFVQYLRQFLNWSFTGRQR